MASYPELKEFDALLSQVVEAKKLSASKMNKLTEMAIELIENDTYLVTSLYRLHRNLAPSSPQKIYSLYCFDSIARACRSKVKKGIGAKIEKKGTFAGFLQQVEGILDGLVEDLVGKKEVDWPEGRDKTKKILDIWTKGLTFPPEVLKRVTARVAAAIADAPAPSSVVEGAPVASSSSTPASNGRGETNERRESSDQSKKSRSPPNLASHNDHRNPISTPTDPRRAQAPAPAAAPEESKSVEAVAPPPPSTSTPPLPVIPAGLLALLQNATGSGSPRSAGIESQSFPSTPSLPPPIAPSPYHQPSYPPPAPSQPIASTSAPLPLTLDASALALLTQLTSQPSFQQPPPNQVDAPPPHPSFPPFPPQQDSYRNYPVPPPTLPQPFANGHAPPRPPPPPLTTRVYNAYDGTFKEPVPPPSLSQAPYRQDFPPPQQHSWRPPPPPNPSRSGWDQPSPRSRPRQSSPPPPQSYHQQPWNPPPSRSPIASIHGRQSSPPRRDQFQPSFDASRGPPPPQRQGGGGWGDQNGYEGRGNWDTNGDDKRGGGPSRGGGEWGGGRRGGGGGGGFGGLRGGGAAGPAVYERSPREPGRGGFEPNGGPGGYVEGRRGSGGEGGRGGGAAGRGGRAGGGGSRWDVPSAQPMRDSRSPPRPSNCNGQHQPPTVPFPPPSMVSPSSYVRQLPNPSQVATRSSPPPRRAPPPPSSSSSSQPPPQTAHRPFIHPSRLGPGQGDVRPPVESRPSLPGLDEFGRAIRQTSADAEDEDDQGPPKTRARLSEVGSAAVESSAENDNDKPSFDASMPSSSSVPDMPPTTTTSDVQSNKRKSRTSASPAPTDPPLPPPPTTDPLASFNWTGFDFHDGKSWEALGSAFYESRGAAPVGDELLELANRSTGGGGEV